MITFIQFVKGEIPEFVEAKDDNSEKSGQKNGTVEKILNVLRDNPKTTQAGLVRITGLSRRGVEWNIAKLKADGIIERVGGDKGGYWKIN